VWWSQGPVEFRNSFSQSQLSASIGTLFFVRSKGFASLWSTHRANKKHRPTTKLSGRSVLRLWAYLSGQYCALWAFRDTARIRNTRFLAVWRKRSILNLRGVLWLWLRDPNGRRREVFGIPKLPPVHSIARWGLCGGHRGLWSSGIPFLRANFLPLLEPFFSSEARDSRACGARTEQIKSTGLPQNYRGVLSSVYGHICPASIAHCGRFETPPESEIHGFWRFGARGPSLT
jgi:hypothetical protein